MATGVGSALSSRQPWCLLRLRCSSRRAPADRRRTILRKSSSGGRIIGVVVVRILGLTGLVFGGFCGGGGKCLEGCNEDSRPYSTVMLSQSFAFDFDVHD